MLIKVDISDASSTSSGNWNNITANGGSVSDCNDFDTGSATGISCAASGGWAGENGGGTTGWSDYPDSATADSLYISSTAQTCTFGSLNSAKTYRVRVIAARNTGATDRVGEYTVDSTLKEIDAAGAVDTWAEWTGVSPDGSDEIVIDVAIKSGSSFAYLNIVELEEESSSGSDISISSTSTATFTGSSSVSAAASVVSAGSAIWNGASVVESDLSVNSSASVTWDTLQTTGADLSVTSVSSAQWGASLSIESDIDASSTSSAQFIAESAVASDVTIAGSAVASWVGSSLSAGDSDFTIGATSLAQWESEQAISADMSADASALMSWVSDSEVVEVEVTVTPPESSKGASGWNSKEWYNQNIKKQKRRQIAQDESDMMSILNEAMPLLMQYYRGI